MRPVLLAGVFALLSLLVWWWPADDPVGVAPGITSRPAEKNQALPGGERATLTSASNPTHHARRERPASRGPAVVAPAMAELARQLHAPGSTATDDLEILQTLVTFYRRTNEGDGPGGGLNHEIVAELRGKNDREIAVLPADLPSFNGVGELLDRWGTPYYFHPVSRAVLEVRSAGPDRNLWTKDDVELESHAEPTAEGLTRN